MEVDGSDDFFLKWVIFRFQPYCFFREKRRDIHKWPASLSPGFPPWAPCSCLSRSSNAQKCIQMRRFCCSPTRNDETHLNDAFLNRGVWHLKNKIGQKKATTTSTNLITSQGAVKPLHNTFCSIRASPVRNSLNPKKNISQITSLLRFSPKIYQSS